MSTPRRTSFVAAIRRTRPWELLPEAALVVGLGVFFITERSAALSAFRSGRAIALMAVAAIIWIVVRRLLVRVDRFRVLRTLLFGVAALGVLAIVVLPAYRNERVVEAFPGPAATAAAARPTPLRSAMLVGIDHRAMGTVSLFRTSDGRHLVGLEQIDIQPGPDYDVYLVPGADRQDPGDGIRLDDLRGNQGTQYYEIPAETIVGAGEWTVLVWCQIFDVPVANATPV
jgi:hypothetical protein